MKTEQPLLITSISAGADLSKNLFVSFAGVLPAADAKSLGVVNADTSSGNMAPVMLAGIALVKSSAAVSVGAAVTTDAAGKAKAVAAAEAVNGYSLDEASGPDELIRILLK